MTLALFSVSWAFVGSNFEEKNSSFKKKKKNCEKKKRSLKKSIEAQVLQKKQLLQHGGDLQKVNQHRGTIQKKIGKCIFFDLVKNGIFRKNVISYSINLNAAQLIQRLKVNISIISSQVSKVAI